MGFTDESKIKSFVVELPRVYWRGPPPRMTITPVVLNELGIKSSCSGNNSAFPILNELYVNRKFSQAKIAHMFDVQTDTVRRWLKRIGVPIRKQGDAVSQAMMKYKRCPFSNDEKEKAYMIGFRYGDLHVQKHGRLIRISVGTTHSAMIKLFKDTFAKYGSFRQYPKYDKAMKMYGWCAYSDLDDSFNFLLDKNEEMPSWVNNDTVLFFQFLSGFFDAEGCISICCNERNCRVVSWIISSTDRQLLEQITDKLNSVGFDFLPPRLAKKANWQEQSDNRRRLTGFAYKKDYWCIKTGIKSDVFRLLSKMELKHEEKILKHGIAIELAKTNWKDAREKIISLRNKIKADVKRYVEEAKTAYQKKKPTEQMSMAMPLSCCP